MNLQDHSADPAEEARPFAAARPALVTALCAAVQGVGGGIGWSTLPPLMPTIAPELGISHAMGGIVWGAASLGIVLAAPFGGTLVDRYGARWTAAGGLLLGAAACAGRAWVAGPWQLALAMFVFGLHVGLCAPAMPRALAGHLPLERLGRANGLATLAYTLTTAATVVLARLVAPLVGGWRPLMVGAGVAMAVVAVVWAVLLRDRLRAGTHARITDVFLLLGNGQMRRLAAVHFLVFGGYLSLLGTLPRLLTDQGVAPADIELTVGSWLVCAGLANVVGPWLSDRIGLRRPIILVGTVVIATALLAMAIAPLGLSRPLLAVSALGGGAFAPILLVLPLEMPGVGPAKAGAALGLLLLVGQIGGVLLPVLTGAAAGSAGFAVAIGGIGLAHLLILVPVLGLRETGKGRPPALGTQAPAPVTP